jgi:DNA-binding winged helix-turn-helix (wHTH) protein
MLVESSTPATLAKWASVRSLHAYTFGPFELDPARRSLRFRAEPVALTARGFDLLLLLIRNRHRMLSRAELFEALWPGVCVEDANLTVNMSLVRKALREERHNPCYIVTLPRRGYRFVGEVQLRRLLGTSD